MEFNAKEISELKKRAAQLRGNLIDMIPPGKVGHLGGSSSIMDVVAALYFKTMRVFDDPKDPRRDRLVFSKGHAVLAQYCGENFAKDCASEAAQAAIARMQECLDHQIALLDCERSVDLRQFWLEDQEFHFAPLNYMNISAFNMQYDSFLHIFMPQHLKNDYVLGRNHSTIAEHRAILKGLRSGDPQKARSAIEKHLNSTLQLSLINFEE